MSKTMDKAAASRIQSATALKNEGKVPKGSFAARAQSASSKQKPDNKPSKTGSPIGKWNKQPKK